ncbi:MAG: hypothetical protein K2F79_04945 [Muribaculaceae bacterium]|nr:hypothetical protein [Muribaculaceae bacterium]
MKAFLVRNSASDTPDVELGADSAVLRHAEPVFVPDPTDRWTSMVAPAIRISRLGTHIRRNPQDYYDAVGAVHVLIPASPSVAPGMPPLAMDRALAPGAWQPVENGTVEMTVRRSVLWGDDPEAETLIAADFSLLTLAADEVVRHISEYVTFRTGDIIIFADAAAHLGTPLIDTRVQAWINGDISLDIRIK